MSRADLSTMRARQNVLLAHGWLSRTSAPFRAALLEDVTWQVFEPGQHLVIAGDDERRELLGLCEGIVAFSAGAGPADTPVLHFARPAFWFGHSMISTGEPARLTATARTRGCLARISAARVRDLLSNRPDWWPHFLQLAGIYGDVAVSIASDLAIRGSERRLVSVLLRLSGHRNAFGGPPIGIVPINQIELAAACNMSRNTANTIIGRLAARGLLTMAQGGIRIDAAPKLLELAPE